MSEPRSRNPPEREGSEEARPYKVELRNPSHPTSLISRSPDSRERCLTTIPRKRPSLPIPIAIRHSCRLMSRVAPSCTVKGSGIVLQT
jgi:hypothetical protein